VGLEYEPTSDSLVTVAGMLHEKLEHIPVVGDECTWSGFAIRVVEVAERGRLQVVMTKVQDDGAEVEGR
jgi:CBS domain containing-hemolysin-like protein